MLINFSVSKKGSEENVQPSSVESPPKTTRRNTVSPVGGFLSYFLGKKEDTVEKQEAHNSTIDVRIPAINNVQLTNSEGKVSLPSEDKNEDPLLMADKFINSTPPHHAET